MATWLHVLIPCLYVFWLIATLINQFHYPWVRKLLFFDIFRLLPIWTFFAPNPGTSDYHVLYRQKDSNNNVSEFIELPIHGSRSLFSFFWNPDKRVKKVLLDLAIDMNRLCASEETNEQNIKVSFDYIAFLNFLSSIPMSPETKSVQFLILATSGFIEISKPRLILCSEFHDV